MKYFWIAFNSIGVASALWGGYISMAPETLPRTNPDAVVCLINLLVMPIFAILSVGYSLRRWKTGPLRRPSWNRNPLNWWGDPLQSLFVTTCVMGATAIGVLCDGPRLDQLVFGRWE